MELHQYGINELWRDGIDLINLKIIYKVRKVRFSFFTYLYIHFVLISSIKVLPKCIAWYIFSEVILVLLSNFKMNLVNFKGHCQGQNVQCGPLLSIWAYLYQKQCMLWSMFICGTYTKSYIWFFTLHYDIWHWMTVKGQINVTYFQVVVSHKWCIIWSKFKWNTYYIYKLGQNHSSSP